ncbi:MAG: hypothetical protein HFJ27_05920 [Clostridia bacterium]|nr:hypothetical protein [Clostridia bacterium]
MIKLLKDKFNSMEEKIKKIMKHGFIFSFLVCMLGIGLLLAYDLNANLDLYYIGLSVFRLSLFFSVEFLICGIAIDTIKKQIC